MLSLAIALTGCTNTNENIYQRLHKRYYNMPSYIAECTVTINSNKSTNTYNLTMTYDNRKNKYRLDYDNISIVLTDMNAMIKKNNTIVSVPVDDGYMLVLPNLFFKSYYQVENTSVTIAATSNHGKTVLESDIINPPKYAEHMELIIDNKKLVPLEMKVYDSQNEEKIHIEYIDFNIVNQINDSTFELD